MAGRRLIAEEEAVRSHFADAASARRRAVLRETVAAFERSDRYHAYAAENLARWRAARTSGSSPAIVVLPGDWGEVTQTLTRTHGECFAVLNMANAYKPGGAYVEGAIAQEENMFRRTDCHFRIGADEYDEARDRYRPETTRLLSAADGRVYLDVARPRVCIRGPEDRAGDGLGYAWLADDEVFPFFELRAAAQDLRDGTPFDRDEARRRIAAQLDTLRDHGIRHAVLSAFGCGAFRNPAREVAEIYRDELAARAGAFALIAFAIFAAGYGPDNYTPFAALFAG
jgi:hypothetical protein